jgi:hypothetical protein
MQIEITGHGEQVAYIEANAANTDHAESDRVMPDPIELFVEWINLGFVVSDDEPYRKPAAEIRSSRYDQAYLQQTWVLDIDSVNLSHLRIASNLLTAMAIRPELELIENGESRAIEYRLDEADDLWPVVTTPLPFDVTFELDPDDEIDACTIMLEFQRPLTQDVAQKLCAQLDVWAEVVVRGGYAPADCDPADSGTLPGGTYQHDPVTIAIDFDLVFSVDFACFETLKAYVARIHRGGHPVRALTVA